MAVLIGTTVGLEGAEELAGRSVGPMAVGSDEVWAIVDGREVWRGAGEWERVATWDGPALTCVQPVGGGLAVGTAEAHVLWLDDGRLRVDESFEALEDRGHWYTPWGGPADTRSMAAEDGTVLVNVHVGGVARRDADGRWHPLVDIDVDVHQVVVGPDGSLLAATGAAGFGRSADGGATWTWDDEGLHGSYCRAVAVAGDHVLLTASTGPGRTRGAVYRRPLGGSGSWELVAGPVAGNIDTFWLAAAGDDAAFVTQDGAVSISDDAGTTWSPAGSTAGRPIGIALR
jgi:hypothetical protein